MKENIFDIWGIYFLPSHSFFYFSVYSELLMDFFCYIFVAVESKE